MTSDGKNYEDQYVSLGKAAKVYGVSRRTMLNWVHNKKISAIKTAGNHYRVNITELIASREKSKVVKKNRLKKIMIIDDDEATLDLLSSIIDKNFDDVLKNTYKTGYDALLEMKSVRPDLILLDLNMPKMDGFEFAKTLYENEDLKEVPIIVISAYIKDGTKEELAQYGITRFLEKLNFRDHIVDTIKGLLD